MPHFTFNLDNRSLIVNGFSLIKRFFDNLADENDDNSCGGNR